MIYIVSEDIKSFRNVQNDIKKILRKYNGLINEENRIAKNVNKKSKFKGFFIDIRNK